MGRRVEKITITGYLSDHNDDQDIKDATMWADLRKRIDRIAAESIYQNLGLQVDDL